MAASINTVYAETFKDISSLVESPEDFLTVQKAYAKKLTKTLKTIYDTTRRSDDVVDTVNVLPELIVSGFDDEQIWQQLELQNDLTVTNLVTGVARLLADKKKCLFQSNALANKIKPSAKAKKSKRIKSKLNIKADEEHLEKDSLDENSVNSEEEELDESDNELSNIKSKVDEGDDKFFDFTGDSDDDLNFDFGPLGQKSDLGEELYDKSDSEEDSSKVIENRNKKSVTFEDEVEKDKNKSSKSKPSYGGKLRSQKGSIVDDDFFKLSELEAFLDQEDKKEERRRRKQEKGNDEESESDEDDDEEDIDLFAEVESDTENILYDNFFDQPRDKVDRPTVDDGRGHKKDGEEDVGADDDDYGTDDDNGTTDDDDGTDDDDDDGTDEEEEKEDDNEDGGEEEIFKHSVGGKAKKNLLADSDSDGEDISEILGGQQKSTYELRQEKLKKKITQMEEDILAEKPWQLSGEIAGGKRPENSLLQENLQFDFTTRLAPEITEETTKTLEDLIRQRIKDKAWDDVERQIKPKENPFEYKKRITLDQEKSKQSLGEIYEQEYLKQQKTEEEETADPDHEDIKKMMQSLFLKLDALSNFHYTPKQAAPEVKIISNQPSIAMEEVAPVSVSDNKMLAPEEVQEKKKGEVKGATEKTKVDKERERKKKKTEKRERQKDKEKRQKLIEKLNPGLGNKYSKEKALKKLEKDSKSGKSGVTLLQGEKREKSGLTSSKSFFTQLQDEVTTRVNSKRAEKRKDKDTAKRPNVKKFKL